MIGYSNATVPITNHAVKGLIKFVVELVFVNNIYLVSLIISQSLCYCPNQIGPLSPIVQ